LRQPVGGFDDVGVRDEITASVNEPAGTGLDERRWVHDDWAVATVHRDFGLDAHGDQDDGGLGAVDRFLHGERGGREWKGEHRDRG